MKKHLFIFAFAICCLGGFFAPKASAAHADTALASLHDYVLTESSPAGCLALVEGSQDLVPSSLKLSSRRDQRSLPRFFKDKSIHTENLPTNIFVKSYTLRISFDYISYNPGLSLLRRLNI